MSSRLDSGSPSYNVRSTHKLSLDDALDFPHGRLWDYCPNCGYAALTPDLYSRGSRIVCVSRVMVDMLQGSLAREISDIRAARDALAARPEVDSERIAVAGFCQGGGFALIGLPGVHRPTASRFLVPGWRLGRFRL